jgi:hypothetical protein
MTDGVLSFDQARDGLRMATRKIIDLEGDFKRAVDAAADTEALYRHELAEAFKRYRKEGQAVEESKITAQAEVAIHSRDRDAAAGELKLAGERLENARDSRRTLWRLVEWSMRAQTAVPAPVGRLFENDAQPRSEYPQ